MSEKIIVCILIGGFVIDFLFLEFLRRKVQDNENRLNKTIDGFLKMSEAYSRMAKQQREERFLTVKQRVEKFKEEHKA